MALMLAVSQLHSLVLCILLCISSDLLMVLSGHFHQRELLTIQKSSPGNFSFVFIRPERFMEAQRLSIEFSRDTDGGSTQKIEALCCCIMYPAPVHLAHSLAIRWRDCCFGRYAAMKSDSLGMYMGILFVDFKTAFNTVCTGAIQGCVLSQQLFSLYTQ